MNVSASRAKNLCLAVAIGALAAVSPAAACADDHVALFAGAQGDYSNYVYLGATVAVPGATIGNGLAFRGIVDTGGYNYIDDPLGLVKANFSGAELDAMYQFSTKSFWSDFGAGANYTYTGLTPNDPTNRRAGHQVEFRLSLDGGAVGGPWRADWTGYYGTRLYDYAGRLGFTHAVSPNWRLGVEGYAEGDPTYHLNQIGPYAGVQFSPKSELQFSGGWSWESGFNPRNYVRASFYQRF
ncbi:MAG: cellulose biosynthesis protein BcsS [Candidatus Eremiobacteraeota bacterium]|nr:cellulose biosynthesis protein BcsS [Candidatus Eremiobacteraeota bacterium]